VQLRRLSAGHQVERLPASGLVGAGALSVQFGAAIATKLFRRVGPAGAVTLRICIAAVVLASLVVIVRPSRARKMSASDLKVALLFGVALAGMNLSFYEAISRIPLGVAVTVEFSGPLALALVGSRRLSDAAWAVLAGTGVALLASGTNRGLDSTGLLLAGLAGAGWIAYILLNKETGRRLDAFTGLSVAMGCGAVLLLPLGIAAGGMELFSPGVLWLGAVVAVLSSVVPYSLELVALRRVTPRAFGVMLSLDPAMATVAGLLVLSQHLTAREWTALGLVMAANLGNSLAGRPGPVATTP
jgi:inner membrane transporter RhtA